MTTALAFFCPTCGAAPNKPCMERGKTRKTHHERKVVAARKSNERRGLRGPRLKG